MLSPFPVIVGPTAGGKTALAVAVSRALEARSRPGGEIITADAFQIYTGMDIGTAKPGEAERGGVPHHLLDIVDPREGFTVHDWLTRAEAALEAIRGRGNLPIVVGGTNLYVRAFLDGMFEGPEPDEDLRAALRARPQEERRAELERIDPDAAAKLHPSDERRTIRALEVYRRTGTPISELQRQWERDRAARPDAVIVGLDWPVEEINRRINARVRAMMERGLLEETRTLYEAGRLGPQAREALGYKQLLEYLEGNLSLEDAVEKIKIETRRFAKNQRTWLKRFRARPNALWLDAGAHTTEEMAEEVVEHLARVAERGNGVRAEETGA